ncbi:hypothetical protein CF327_g7505 [Tilletia walkeri]|nr:hypothetical protein CF327_g7505 [Tilletia walkeri]
MQDYGADPYEADRSTGNYKVGAGWPEAALVGAAAGAAVGGGAAAAAARRSHRRSIHGAEGQTSSGSGSGNAWSSGSTHEVPKSSSGVLISGSSAGHRSGSLDEAVAGGPSGGVTSLSPPPRPARSRTSTAGSLKEPASLTSLANVGSSGSPQDRVRLPAFPEGFGEGDLHDHAGVAPQGSSQPQTTTTGTNNFLGPDSTVLAEAAAAGTGGALGLLAAQHRTSMASMYDYQSEGHSQSVRTPDESELPSRHSNFLSRGTHLLGPGAAGSSRSSAMSSLENPDGGAEAAGSGDAVGRAGSSQLETLAVPTVTEFGEQQAHQSKSRTTLNSGHLGRQLSTIFGSESEPSLGVGQSSSAQQQAYVASAHGSGTGSSSGRDSNIESLGARSGSAGAGAGASITTNMRSARGSGASDGRVPASLIGAIQRGQGHVDASPAGTFGVAELAGSPPSTPRRTSLVSGGIRVVGPTQAARVSRSPTPGTGTGVPSRVPSAERGSGLGLASADSSRARSPDDGDLEAASTEDLAHDHSEAGLLSSVAAGLRRLGGGWLPGGGANRPGAADAGGFGRRLSIGVATMGARTAAGTAVGTPTGQGTPARPETAQSGEAAAALAAASRRTSGVGVSTGASSSMSSIQRPDLARLSTATSQAVAGSREGSGSEPSAGYSASLSSGERSAGLDSVSHLTHNTSSGGQRSVHGSRGSGSGSHRSRGGRSEGSNSGPSTHSAGTGSGSGFSYTTSELARRNTLSTHAEMDEEAALRRASLSGATSPAVYTASEGASAESHSAAAARRDVPANAGPTVDSQPRLTNPASATAPNAQSTIRAVGADRSGRPGLPDFPAHPVLMPGLPGALPIRGPTGSPSGSWRQSPRVASLSQRAADVQARTAEGSPAPARSSGTGSGSGDHRNRSQSVVASSPDDFEWRDLADTFPTPLDRALREAEQRDLEEQTQGRQQNRYDWPKFLRF